MRTFLAVLFLIIAVGLGSVYALLATRSVAVESAVSAPMEPPPEEAAAMDAAPEAEAAPVEEARAEAPPDPPAAKPQRERIAAELQVEDAQKPPPPMAPAMARGFGSSGVGTAGGGGGGATGGGIGSIGAAPAKVEADAPAPPPKPSLADQFKAREVAYNRPPSKLVLGRAIDVSLAINATDRAGAAAEAVQGFPGTVVEREVELSDVVSAQLTGSGFHIEKVTVERQKLSDRVANRWQWRVTPTEPGPQTLILEIFGYEDGSPEAEPLDAYRDTIDVEVEQVDVLLGLAAKYEPLFGFGAGLAGTLSAIFGLLRFVGGKKKV